MAEFTNGELKLLFQRIDEKLDDIKANMDTRDARYDRELIAIKDDVDSLKTAMTKIMTIGGAIWAILTASAVFILQAIFK